MTNESRSYGWVVVAVGALMGCMAVGAMFSLAVFLTPMTRDTGWSRAAISTAMTLNFLTMGAAGFAWGALSDRFGARLVVLGGSVLLGTGLVLASRATSELEFQLVYGVLIGVSAGSFFAPMISAASAWFERHQGLAVSLVSVGVGIAPMTMSPLAAWLLSISDWRAAQMTIGILVWIVLIPAALLVRRAPAAAGGVASASASPASPGSSSASASSASASSVPASFGATVTADADGTMSVARALRSPAFIVLAATFFACCATHAGPILHTINYTAKELFTLITHLRLDVMAALLPHDLAIAKGEQQVIA